MLEGLIDTLSTPAFKPCKVERWRQSLDAVDREQIDKALAMDVNTNRLFVELTRLGVDAFGQSALDRHRKGVCSCRNL